MANDILLDRDGDLYIQDVEDITLKDSIVQEVKIKLQWFFSEWRFAPELGVPYFEDIFIKNPNKERISQIIREEASSVDGVTDVKNITVDVNNVSRTAIIGFTILTDYNSYREELEINV